MELPAISVPRLTMAQQRPAMREDARAATGGQANGSVLPESVTGALPPIQEKGSNQRDGSISGRAQDNGECQTCKSRKYQDGSNDPGVSFKTPTEIDANSAASAVRGHEMEHVVREQFKAAQQNRRVVSQTVTMHNAICPECGRTYISGGTTRTVTTGEDQAKLFQAGMPEENPSGKQLSTTV